MMNIKKYTLLIASAVMGIGFAGNLLAIDLPGLPGFNQNGGGTTAANNVSILTCRNIGQNSSTTGTGSSSCESAGSGASNCSSSTGTGGANTNGVISWESTREIDPALLGGTCPEAMQALGNCSIQAAYGDGVIVIQCN
ncbi:MAG: hypothetical protein GQ583_11785 [Methyloprofundus sp.]|nr:hypothetical protein [Methyloprofundus sp.]